MESTLKIPLPLLDTPDKMVADYNSYLQFGKYETAYNLSELFPFDDFTDLYFYDIIRRILHTDGYQLETSSAGEWDYSWVNFTLYKNEIYAGVVIVENVPVEKLFEELIRTYNHGEKVIVGNRMDYPRDELVRLRSMYSLDVDCFNKHTIGKWISALNTQQIEVNFQIIVKNYVDSLISFLIKQPSYLYKVEWRDLEKILAETFTVFSFDVTLTRASKDGGFDIYLTGMADGKKSTYIVEVKHWTVKKVGKEELRKLFSVSVMDSASGIFISTSGFNNSIMEMIYDFDFNSILLGDKKIIYQLCNAYLKAKNGLWYSEKDLKSLEFLNKK